VRALSRKIYGHGIKRPRNKITAASRKRLAQKHAANTTAKGQIATREILDIYEPGWQFVPADPRTKRKTRSGIALWLARSGLVTGFKNEVAILKVLEKLARQRKIKLPPKTTSGGAHKKKK
jgi:hypothetical protein